MQSIKQWSLMAVAGLMSFSLFAKAQIKNAKTETVTIQGSSPACKKMIEYAGNRKRIARLTWNADTKTAQLTYNAKATTKEAVLKRVALAGFDNEVYNAPLSAYRMLTSECYYKGAPQTTDINTTDSTKDASKLAPLYRAYFAISNALVRSDEKTAGQKAGELHHLVKAVQMDALSPEEHTAWMHIKAPLNEQSAALKAAAGIEKQRVTFAALSESVYQLFKASKLPYKIYYNECPMFHGGATWLSREESIRNPYYGAAMMTCGATKAVIGQ
ncbi:hypothetical protein A8C56_14105 [Niabella ginsenosidivorans]|uniref:DUF3347 domain-containing protein n=1 Tax=Niabella ginsenosidivorans TaxID=1176587 RepID=A0A1A9I8J9_9BACT|nr:DUF3347 domain-containing protein [Niabella ginsenosidivorans]ANH83946.1 hypothetical protein A8C56_14105 [Niabella ginsenosidivorans]